MDGPALQDPRRLALSRRALPVRTAANQTAQTALFIAAQ